MDSRNYKYTFECLAVPGHGLVFKSDSEGMMFRFIAQAHSEALEIEVRPDHTIFVPSIDVSQECAQSFIDDWFNPECVVLNYTIYGQPEPTSEAQS